MDLRTSCLSPTAPRPTMPVLLIMMCLFATVPSIEAAPLASLPSFSSPTGILVAFLSAIVVLSLVVGLVFALKIKNFFKKVMKKVKRSKRGQAEKEEEDDRVRNSEEKKKEEETEQQQREVLAAQATGHDKDPSDTVDSKSSEDEKPTEDEESSEVDIQTEDEIKRIQVQFYVFIKKWQSFSLKNRQNFVVETIKGFPVVVTPSMALDALRVMLSKEVNAAVWMRMVRFILLLERDLFYWDQPELEKAKKGKIMAAPIHERFQAFLVIQAEKILAKYGDVASGDEEGFAGFMRFIAYLFGFVCKDRRILKLMEDTWSREGFGQTDFSRAMVWGFRRWMDDPRSRDPHRRPTTIESNGNHHTFHKLMHELRTTNATMLQDEGRIDHLLFALGFGDEPEGVEGPLAYMSKQYKFTAYIGGGNYLWLMMGRDLMGNAWQWMRSKGPYEYDRMFKRFGGESHVYEIVMDMVLKYEQEYSAEQSMNTFATCHKSFTYLAKKVDFDKHRAWFERYQRKKAAIRDEVYYWLAKNTKDDVLDLAVSREPPREVDYYKRLAQEWEENDQ